jgi:uroporphyrinogen decarboxylase
MKPRERVLTALKHQEPDRVPIDFGGTGISSATEEQQKRLREILGLTEKRDPRFLYFDNVLQDYFGVDFRRIGMRGPHKPKNKVDEKGRPADEWGVADYNDSAFVPLRNFSIADLKSYDYPDPYDAGRIEGIKAYAKFLHNETDYAIVADAPGMGLFEAGCRLRGYDQFMLDFAANQDFIRAFFDIYLDLLKKFVDIYLGEIGDYIDIIWLGDDAATQRAPYISPRQYRQLVKPYFIEYVNHIKKYTKAHIMHHCCGSSFTLIPEYLDIGIEILNPCQPEAVNMEAWRLKNTYGDRMCFHSGIGIQYLLPQGTPQEVVQSVQETAKILGKNGGYICAAGHTPPDDVPAENLIALFETAKTLTYPLR